MTLALQQRTSMTTDEHSPSVSPDGTSIAYVDGRFVYAVNAAGQRVQLASIPSGTIRVPAWQRNGQGVVYQNNARQIVIGTTAVTTGEDTFPFPVTWLPDGSFIYTADGKVRARNADGSNPRDIAFTAALDVVRPVVQPKDFRLASKQPRQVQGIYSPVMSPDGKKIAFVALNDLWLLDLTSGSAKPQQLTNDTFIEWTPSWSSDNAKVFFTSDRHGGGLPEMYSIDLRSKQVTRLSTTPSGTVVDAVVAPDGRSFAYVNGTNQSLRVHDIATNQSRLVANQAYESNVGKPAWSPDGRMLANADMQELNTRFREGRNMIRTIDVATGAWQFREPGTYPRALSERFEAGPAWSPDGKWMAYVMDSRLHVMPVAFDGAPTGPVAAGHVAHRRHAVVGSGLTHADLHVARQAAHGAARRQQRTRDPGGPPVPTGDARGRDRHPCRRDVGRHQSRAAAGRGDPGRQQPYPADPPNESQRARQAEGHAARTTSSSTRAT